jgi:hypothetical protein
VIVLKTLIAPVPLRHYCASSRFYSVAEDGLIAPSLESVLLGPHPPLLIAAATPSGFPLCAGKTKRRTVTAVGVRPVKIETHEHKGEFKEL